MEKLLETKTVAVAKVPSGATAVLYVALVDGVPTEAQVETGRNALAATLEIVGATNVSSFLTRFIAKELADDETLRLDVAASLSKVAPDSLPGIIDETSPEESASGEAETPLDENAAAIDATETSEA